MRIRHPPELLICTWWERLRYIAILAGPRWSYWRREMSLPTTWVRVAFGLTWGRWERSQSPSRRATPTGRI